MGGSLNPNGHDYHLAPRAKYRTVHCSLYQHYRSEKTYNVVSAGVESCDKHSTDHDLILQEKFGWAGMKDNGYDSMFYYQDPISQELHNLFWNPDVLTKGEVGMHENYLRNICPYARGNLVGCRHYLNK